MIKDENISVKFGFFFKDKYELIPTSNNIKAYSSKQLRSIKPRISSVLKGLESENKLRIGDVILKLDKYKINNVYDFFKAKKKLKWNSSVILKIIRNKKEQDIKLDIKNFLNFKKKFPRLGIEVERKSNDLIISNVSMMSSVVPEFTSATTLRVNDRIISIDHQKIENFDKYCSVLQNIVPGRIVHFLVARDEQQIGVDIKIISFGEFIKLNRKFCKNYWPKEVWKQLVDEYEDNDFYLSESYKIKMIVKKEYIKKYSKKIVKTGISGFKQGRFKFTKKGKIKTIRKNSLIDG